MLTVQAVLVYPVSYFCIALLNPVFYTVVIEE